MRNCAWWDLAPGWGKRTSDRAVHPTQDGCRLCSGDRQETRLGDHRDSTLDKAATGCQARVLETTPLLLHPVRQAMSCPFHRWAHRGSERARALPLRSHSREVGRLGLNQGLPDLKAVL